MLIDLPHDATYAEKRGFGDATCDGITDMIEIEDTVIFGQKYEVRIFTGYFEEGILHFKSNPKILPLPTSLSWFSSATKLDVGDVNGDGCADIIFTQYIEQWGRDKLNIGFALNNQGNEFVLQTSQIAYGENNTLEDIIVSILEIVAQAEITENVSDYLKMDWADMDGNGSDDLVLAWDRHNDLYVHVFFTEKTAHNVRFIGEREFFVKGFMTGRYIRYFDTEDYDCDGIMDVYIRHSPNETTAYLSIALNRGTHLEPHKDFLVKDTDMDFFRFEKHDTFDINGDHCADMVHVGSIHRKKSLSYNLIRPHKEQ